MCYNFIKTFFDFRRGEVSGVFDKKSISEYFASSPLIFSRGIKAVAFDGIDSTNTEARRYALGHPEASSQVTVFVARSQSAGRGRMGRSFFSPADSGLYLTALFDASDMSAEQLLCLTPAAAVATLRTVRALGADNAAIKWVNDIYIAGKKACGILAESFTVDKRRFVAIGVGINLYTEAFPEELADIATSVLGNGRFVGAEEKRKSLMLAAERLAAELYDLCAAVRRSELGYMEEYRAASAVLGRRVSYVKDGCESYGIATDVDDIGRLSVRDESGNTVLLSGGEISLFLK